MLSGGLQPVRTVLRALALGQMDGGLERALFEAPRPGKSPVLDQEQRQRIIAVACSPPPKGRAR
jgi:hypothetical protein